MCAHNLNDQITYPTRSATHSRSRNLNISLHALIAHNNWYDKHTSGSTKQLQVSTIWIHEIRLYSGQLSRQKCETIHTFLNFARDNPCHNELRTNVHINSSKPYETIRTRPRIQIGNRAYQFVFLTLALCETITAWAPTTCETIRITSHRFACKCRSIDHH